MGIVELLLIAVGLSMDAFAVSVCSGMAQTNFSLVGALKVGLYFGAAQMIMPILGYLAGGAFSAMISDIDHWVAFALLAFIGGKMLFETFSAMRGGGEPGASSGIDGALTFSKLLPLAVATSIDALAVGVSFALLDINIVPASITIGLITFALSAAGFRVGFVFGVRFRSWATLAGGAMLIAISLKILLEHLFGGA